MDNITRVCRKCGQEKPLIEFVKDKKCALGRKYVCQQCDRERKRKEYAANPEKARERFRKWRAANPEKARESYRKWRAANTEKARELGRKYSAANPEKGRERSRRHCAGLTDCYLRVQLKQMGIPITPETIEYKRIQLKLYREIKKQTDYERN